MSKTVVILQPGYLPWLGFYEQMVRSDAFVYFDDAQYSKESWRNRNRIKTPQGAQWLTVPVLLKGRGFPPIREVEIDNTQSWKRSHLGSIVQNYRKAPHFQWAYDALEEVYANLWERLIDLDVALVDTTRQLLGLDRTVVFSSQLGVEGEGTERLVGISRAVGADQFYEGAVGEGYVDMKAFDAAGIRVEFQRYDHPVYPQLHGAFLSHLSIIDLLFNCGPQSLDILVGKTSEVVG